MAQPFSGTNQAQSGLQAAVIATRMAPTSADFKGQTGMASHLLWLWRYGESTIARAGAGSHTGF